MPIGVPVSPDGQKTFLEICQRAVQECRVTHQLPLRPTTVLGQSGEMRRFVDWAAEAWVDLQNVNHDWKFKRQSASFVTIAGQSEYTTAACGIEPGTFKRWLPHSFRNYNTIAGFSSEIHMDYLEYDVWRNLYLFGANRTTTSRPTSLTVLPNNGIGLGLPPLAGYTVMGDYYTAPVRMETDEEVPALPIGHSFMILVYKVMMEYGLSEPAPEIFARGEKGYRRLLRMLEADQLPDLQLGGALR